MTYPTPAALLAAALAAAERRWHVFPLAPGAKQPAIRAWEERATTDPERIARCWATGPYNVGIATGPARLLVVDLDIPKGEGDTPPPPWNLPGVTDGADVLADLCERHGKPFPFDTHTVRTASGGTHLYFAAPEAPELRNSAGKLGWKVDTRAAGGYVVGPGSVVSGQDYVVVHEAPAAPLPGWLADLLAPAPLPLQTPVTVPLATDRRGAYLRSAVTAELDRVTGAVPGTRNTALYRAAVALGQLVAGGELNPEQVTAWLSEAAARAGQTEHEARNTIASGLRAGANRPRTVAA